MFMEIIIGMEVSQKIRGSKLFKIKKALYGLRISPRRRNKKFPEVENSMGLVNYDYDHLLYTWS